MGVGAVEVQQDAEQGVIRDRRQMANERPGVLGTGQDLRANDHRRVTVEQPVQRAAVEVDVAEVDLVAHDDGPSGAQDPLLQRPPVVRPADGEVAHVVVLRGEVAAQLHSAVGASVLAQQDLVGPIERTQPLAQIDDGGVEDGLLVVDGDDDGDLGLAHGLPRGGSLASIWPASSAASRPNRMASAMAE